MGFFVQALFQLVMMAYGSLSIYPGDTLDANALFPLGDTGDHKSFQNAHTFPTLTKSENSYDENQEILQNPDIGDWRLKLETVHIIGQKVVLWENIRRIEGNRTSPKNSSNYEVILETAMMIHDVKICFETAKQIFNATATRITSTRSTILETIMAKTAISASTIRSKTSTISTTPTNTSTGPLTTTATATQTRKTTNTASSTISTTKTINSVTITKTAITTTATTTTTTTTITTKTKITTPTATATATSTSTATATPPPSPHSAAALF